MIPLQSNPYVEEVQRRVNIKTNEQSKPSNLVKTFLQSCLHLLRDEKAISEIHNLIDSYDRSMFVFAAEPAE